MSTEIENLIYYIKEISGDYPITITEKGFNINFNILYRPMDTCIEVDQEGFNVRSKKLSVRVNFQEHNLEYKFKLITNYMVLVKQISLDAVENSVKPLKGD